MILEKITHQVKKESKWRTEAAPGVEREETLTGPEKDLILASRAKPGVGAKGSRGKIICYFFSPGVPISHSAGWVRIATPQLGASDGATCGRHRVRCTISRLS